MPGLRIRNKLPRLKQKLFRSLSTTMPGHTQNFTPGTRSFSIQYLCAWPMDLHCLFCSQSLSCRWSTCTSVRDTCLLTTTESLLCLVQRCTTGPLKFFSTLLTSWFSSVTGNSVTARFSLTKPKKSRSSQHHTTLNTNCLTTRMVWTTPWLFFLCCLSATFLGNTSN